MNKYAPEMHKYEVIQKIRVGIVGARGYSGLELLRTLLKHPQVEIVGCFATDSTFAPAQYLPELGAKKGTVPVFDSSELPRLAKEIQTVFLATPADVSLALAPKLLESGCNVIDLSGGYRLGVSQAKTDTVKKLYQDWYGLDHTSPELSLKACYGLVPWLPASLDQTPKLIANPGCYATAVLMALLPLLKEGLIDPQSIVIDAKSGASGAGRKASEAMLFNEVDGECLPYRVGKHQHLPEICQVAEAVSQQSIDPFFTTHLIPVRRGIIAGIYAKLSGGSHPNALASLEEAFSKAYSDYPLAWCAPLADPESSQLLSLKQVVGSARVHIRYSVMGDKLYLFSLLDNLLKGAATQAIENFNLLHHLPVSTALLEMEGLL